MYPQTGYGDLSGLSLKLIEDGRAKPVGRGPSPSPALVLSLTTKKHRFGNSETLQEPGFSAKRGEAKMADRCLALNSLNLLLLEKVIQCSRVVPSGLDQA